MNVNEQERRRYLRVSLNCQGIIRLANGPEAQTQVIDISEGGLRCVSSQPVALGTSAELRFTLPVAIGKACVVVGRVQHHHRHDQSYALGIEFTRTTADVIMAIRAFIKQSTVTR